ncbi:PAS domain-containing protein, partial [candidate division KSB3 bacterium]|nr:PAS domain-containing protein [candidate division KSB3 bacterium]MBD3324356.1 PAS domain-containing protein [candidate division KSB3 bacterium]
LQDWHHHPYPAAPSRTPHVKYIGGMSADKIYKTAMQPYEPTAILLSQDNEVEYIFGDAGKYISMTRGKVDINILKVIRDDLSIALGTALNKARRDKQEVVYTDIMFKEQDALTRLDLTVRPLFAKDAPEILLVIFEERRPTPEIQAKQGEAYDPERYSHLRIKDLQNELQITKENLQATVEELETSNEELQATNEELMASNEELQSTNEELQSVNEELVTVNAEYQQKVEELTALNNDFDNLLASTQIGTLFLDRKLYIRKLTPNITPLLNIVPSDVGRPITHFSKNFAYDDFINDIQDALIRGETRETEICTEGNTWYLLRIHQLLMDDRDVDGVVITFVDITDRKQAEETLAHQAEILQKVSDAIITTDVNLTITSWNPAAEKIYGWQAQEVIGQRIDTLLQTEFLNGQQQNAQHTLLQEKFWQGELRQTCKDGEPIYVFASVSLLEDANGNPVGGVTINHDITALKHAQHALTQTNETLERTVQTRTTELDAAKKKLEKMIQISTAGIYIYDLVDNHNVYSNKEIFDTLGYTSQELHAMGSTVITELAHSDDLPKIQDHHHRLRTAKDHEVLELEYRMKGADGTWRWLYSRDTPFLRDEHGLTRQILGSVFDITCRKQLETQLQDTSDRLREAVNIARLGKWDWNIHTNEFWCSDVVYTIFEQQPTAFEATYEAFLACIHPDDRPNVEHALKKAVHGHPFHLDHRLLLPDNTIKYVHEEGRVYYDQDGQPARMIGTVQDITQWKANESS